MNNNRPRWSQLRKSRRALQARMPKDKFFDTVLEGCCRVGRDRDNPLRGNFVASGLREAIGTRVDEAVLLRKAASWRYEREWRLIGKRGSHDSPLELEEIIFGMRCKPTVKYTIVQALAKRVRPVRFSQMREVSGTFRLRKNALDADELSASLPRRSRCADGG